MPPALRSLLARSIRDSTVLTFGEEGGEATTLSASSGAQGVLTTFALPGSLSPGKRYALQVTAPCGELAPQPPTNTIEWIVEQPSPAPTTLGALRVGEAGVKSVEKPNGKQDCFDYRAYGFVTLTLDQSSWSPGWRNALRNYELLVDGEVQPSVEQAGHSAFYLPPAEPAEAYLLPIKTLTLFRWCDELSGSERHVVSVRATVPDQSLAQIVSSTVEVELSCPLPDAGVQPQAEYGVDAAPPAPAPATRQSDAGSTSEPEGEVEGEPPAAAAGCDVGVSGRSSALSLGAFLMLLVLSARVARRRKV